tara:strand:+ start:780 stop:1169 length:390 start_codon:yes stop_codon:yes gene_type:complete
MNAPDQPKVLIVDDDKTNLRLLSDIIRSEAKVILALSGEQALKKTVEFKPDLILLDLIMPEMDGYKVLEKLKQATDTCHIPVVCVSGVEEDDEMEKALQLGACDYVKKPFHFEHVKEQIQQHLRRLSQH